MNETPAAPGLSNVEPSAREVFLSWERYRVVYNSLLTAIVCLCLSVRGNLSLLGDREFLWHLFVRAFGANLCFGLGPWLEGWFRYGGEGGPTSRMILFVLGTGFAMLLAAASIMTFGLNVD